MSGSRRRSLADLLPTTPVTVPSPTDSPTASETETSARVLPVTGDPATPSLPSPEEPAPTQESLGEGPAQMPSSEPDHVSTPVRSVPRSGPGRTGAQAGGRSKARPSADKPLYLSLLRKEVRLSEAQYDALTALARRLNRSRRRGPDGEPLARITENTLIRVAIDLLLERKSSLTGDTEEQLFESMRDRASH